MSFSLPLLILSILPADPGALHSPPRQAARPTDAGLVCAIDMGSNTFRRIVGSFRGGAYDQRKVEKKTLGVGDDVARHGRISEEKLAEIRETLSTFKSACLRDGAARIAAIGTAAFRDAANGAAVIDIAAGVGVAMEIASERRESELAYLVGALGRDGSAVIDHGSRSIELVSENGGTVQYSVSSLGYRIAYEKFFAAGSDPQAAVGEYRDHLRREASKAPFMKGKKRLVGVEFGEMAGVLFDSDAVEGRILTLSQLRERLNRITLGGPSAFAALKTTAEIDRALPRLVAAEFFADAFGYAALELTDRELGSGLIIEAGMKKQ
jgi:exopolyphosphatase/pppGpp-phosphohydrolase